MDTPSPPAAVADVTMLLAAWRAGDATAGDRLLQIVYDELHRQAARAMRREDSAHTLQATALVNEAYLRLVDQRRMEWRNRAQFFGIAAQVMRRILVDHARARHAGKRGAGGRAVSLTNVDGAVDGSGDEVDLLALHDALERLGSLDPLQARLVELRYFAGLSIDETAEALEISASTVKREWVVARAWLRRELERR